MKKAQVSPSRKIKENMKSILEHTQYKKKKTVRSQMHDLDINCLDSIKRIILVCLGGGGSPMRDTILWSVPMHNDATGLETS